MDDPALGADEHAHALRGLAHVHRLTGTTRRLWSRIAREFKGANRLVVLDVGCGDGLMLRQLFRLAQKQGIELELHACDFSHRALEMARDAAEAERIPLNTHLVDIIDDELDIQADIVICSLFLHHFSEPDVVGILRKLGAATRRLLLIEDLLRTQLGLLMCWIGVHALTRSRIVHVDGPLSVRAAFTKSEITSLVSDAGLSSAQIKKHWPERFLIDWSPAGKHA